MPSSEDKIAQASQSYQSSAKSRVFRLDLDNERLAEGQRSIDTTVQPAMRLYLGAVAEGPVGRGWESIRSEISSRCKSPSQSDSAACCGGCALQKSTLRKFQSCLVATL